MKKFVVLCFILIIFSTPAEAAEKRGNIEIPCLKINMPFFSTDDAQMQDVIDEEQSALFYRWQQATRIVDHLFSEDENGNNWNIQKIFPGAYATITIDGKRYFYECYLTAKTEYRYDQEFINSKLLTPSSSYDILVSCCAEDSEHHFVAVFRRLSEFT